MTQRLFQIHVYIATMSPIEYFLMVIMHETIASRNNNQFICNISYLNSYILHAIIVQKYLLLIYLFLLYSKWLCSGVFNLNNKHKLTYFNKAIESYIDRKLLFKETRRDVSSQFRDVVQTIQIHLIIDQEILAVFMNRYTILVMIVYIDRVFKVGLFFQCKLLDITILIQYSA